MNIKVLNNKPTININNFDYLDLSYNSFNTDLIYNYILGYDVVTAETEMRIDKIALKWYGNTENIDILLKANNIFNPFSIKIDDVLVIPSIDTIEQVIRDSGVVKEDDIRDLILANINNRKTDVSKLTNSIQQNKDKKHRLKNPLPPNILQKGDASRSTQNGFINLTNNS